MQVWDNITQSVRRPQPFRIVLFYISNCLQRIAQTFVQFTYIQNCIREKYLIKLFIQYGYEYLSTKSHSRPACQSTDREVDSSSPHAPDKFCCKQSVIWH